MSTRVSKAKRSLDDGRRPSRMGSASGSVALGDAATPPPTLNLRISVQEIAEGLFSPPRACFFQGVHIQPRAELHLPQAQAARRHGRGKANRSPRRIRQEQHNSSALDPKPQALSPEPLAPSSGSTPNAPSFLFTLRSTTVCTIILGYPVAQE